MKHCKRGSQWPSSVSVTTTELPCEVCNSAPATLTCKADAAALCITCDTDIHTANPLASRHLRLPIHRYVVDDSTKFFGEPKLNPGRTEEPMKFPLKARLMKRQEDPDDGVDEKESNSWLLSQPNGKSLNRDADDGMQLGAAEEDQEGEVSEYLDLVHYGEAYEDNHSSSQVQSDQYIEYLPEEKEEDDEGNEISLQNWGLKTEYDYSTFLSGTVSTSTLDNGRVIDAVLPVQEGFNLRASSGSLMEVPTGLTTMQTPQCSPMDREARVLRYREKRKNRKFEKTIRYASRKAYAETRPRIKGRFAKRADMDGEVEVDTIYSSRLIMETGYGMVPTF